MSKEKPILFNSEMVKAILDGRKTQTRRVIKPEPVRVLHEDEGGHIEYKGIQMDFESDLVHYCPYGVVGDRLWVREKWAYADFNNEIVIYWADGEDEILRQHPFLRDMGPGWLTWKPSIHMKKEHCRIWLEITGIKVERVQEISEEDAITEGLTEYFWDEHAAKIPHIAKEINKGKRWWEHVIIKRCRKGSVWDCPRKAFRELWDDINAKRGYGWKVNSLVWVIEFRKESYEQS
jgi:hypothetical protein